MLGQWVLLHIYEGCLRPMSVLIAFFGTCRVFAGKRLNIFIWRVMLREMDGFFFIFWAFGLSAVGPESIARSWNIRTAFAMSIRWSCAAQEFNDKVWQGPVWSSPSFLFHSYSPRLGESLVFFRASTGRLIARFLPVECLNVSHFTSPKNLSSSLSSLALPRLVCCEAPAGAVPFISLGTLQIYRWDLQTV